MKVLKISVVLLWLSISVASAQEKQSGNDPLMVSGEKKVDFEAETVKMLTSKISDWQSFSFPMPELAEYEFRYPAGLKFELHYNTGFLLYHSIPFEHNNPCVFSDEPAPPLKELYDFRIQFWVYDRDLKSAVTVGEGPASQNLLIDDSLKIMPGYVDTIRIGSFKGFRITSGVEGCGHFNYYFPLNKSQTLVIKRYHITELNPIVSNYREFRRLPGVILPDEEEYLFKRIISTFRFQ